MCVCVFFGVCESSPSGCIKYDLLRAHAMDKSWFAFHPWSRLYRIGTRCPCWLVSRIALSLGMMAVHSFGRPLINSSNLLVFWDHTLFLCTRSCFVIQPGHQADISRVNAFEDVYKMCDA